MLPFFMANVLIASYAKSPSLVQNTDVVAYGASGAACIAAIAAHRTNPSHVVTLLSQTNHIGGV